MPTLDEPVTWDRTIYRGASHSWELRRVDEDGEPIIPTSAEAQIRASFGGEIWIECDVDIDSEDGWVSISFEPSETSAAKWGSRDEGVWDIFVIVSGKRLRWAMGKVTVSQDVTR